MVQPAGIVIGGLILLAGVALYRGAYIVARFNEQLDAIGSKRSWSNVVPAGWNVAWHQTIGMMLMMVGGVFFLFSLLP